MENNLSLILKYNLVKFLCFEVRVDDPVYTIDGEGNRISVLYPKTGVKALYLEDNLYTYRSLIYEQKVENEDFTFDDERFVIGSLKGLNKDCNLELKKAVSEKEFYWLKMLVDQCVKPVEMITRLKASDGTMCLVLERNDGWEETYPIKGGYEWLRYGESYAVKYNKEGVFTISGKMGTECFQNGERIAREGNVDEKWQKRYIWPLSGETGVLK